MYEVWLSFSKNEVPHIAWKNFYDRYNHPYFELIIRYNADTIDGLLDEVLIDFKNKENYIQFILEWS